MRENGKYADYGRVVRVDSDSALISVHGEFVIAKGKRMRDFCANRIGQTIGLLLTRISEDEIKVRAVGI